jgi:hypothetical protein
MKFYTKQECINWSELLRIPMDSEGWPDSEKDFGESFRCVHPKEPYRIFNLAQVIESATNIQDERLLWVTNSYIWPSNENSHLYYKLKESYHDSRLIGDSPGHLFLKHESNDVTSFLQLVMLFGWDAYLFSSHNFVRIFCSHDEWIKVFANDIDTLEAVRKSLTAHNFPVAAA